MERKQCISTMPSTRRRPPSSWVSAPSYLGEASLFGDGPPFVKYGGKRVVYLRSDLEAWRDAQRRTSTTSDQNSGTRRLKCATAAPGRIRAAVEILHQLTADGSMYGIRPMRSTGVCRSHKDRHHASPRQAAACPPPSKRHQQVCDGGNLAVALQYAEAGIAVFPCFEAGPRAKEPRTQHGHHDATTDIHEIRAWWQSLAWRSRRYSGRAVFRCLGPGR